MNRRILILICIYVGLIFLFAYLRPEKLDWTPSFSPQRSIPFAAEVFFRELGSIRTELLRLSDMPIYNTVRDLQDDQSSIYFFLNNFFDPSALDFEKLMEYVANGGIAFISSSSLPDALQDTLDLHTQFQFIGVQNRIEWFYEDNLELHLTNYPDSTWPASTASGYYWYQTNDSMHTVLGTFGGDHPNFIACAFGEGTFYFHSFPYMFSNYHMLYKSNHHYVSRVMAEVPVADIWIWDTYYLTRLGGRAQTPLIALNQFRSFRWAFWLGIIGVCIFLFFTAKRRQRIIPVLKAKRNTTLDFVRTIGDLYFHRSDHGDLVRKKIAILQSQIQKRYRLAVYEFSPEEADELAIRSGGDPAHIGVLFQLIRGLRNNTSPRVETVFALQKRIDTFLHRT